jgi:hypothetical protein
LTVVVALILIEQARQDRRAIPKHRAQA